MTHSPAYAIAVDAMGSWNGMPGVMASIVANVRDARARRRTRREYEALMLRDDQIFSDIGVSRSDVRRAMDACR